MFLFGTILFLIAGHMYRTNWGIGHGLKDILEAHKGPRIFWYITFMHLRFM
ncbi:putative photosystem I [Helianthus anomalus]